jgi:hypothetical protein
VQRKAMELLPSDPRLPDTLADGVTPWPREAGALLVKCSYLLDTREGREAWTEVKADGAHAAQRIGYRVTDGGSKTSGGVRPEPPPSRPTAPVVTLGWRTRPRRSAGYCQT